jgi:uncharacterized membrane protein YraQ (UPF0718 family)
MKKKNVKESAIKTARALWGVFPFILGTILLVSLMITLVPKSFYMKIFSGNVITDSLIGGLVGSVSVGTPITSYIFGGEMLEQGISLIAVTAFLVAWVTVGIVQLPAEAYILGKKFALLRNLASFILSIVVAIVTVAILKVI